MAAAMTTGLLSFKKIRKLNLPSLSRAAVVAHRQSIFLQSKTLEVVGSNPAGCWAFSSLLYPISSPSLIQVPLAGTTQLIFQQKCAQPCSLRQSKLKMHGLSKDAYPQYLSTYYPCGELSYSITVSDYQWWGSCQLTNNCIALCGISYKADPSQHLSCTQQLQVLGPLQTLLQMRRRHCFPEFLPNRPLLG